MEYKRVMMEVFLINHALVIHVNEGKRLTRNVQIAITFYCCAMENINMHFITLNKIVKTFAYKPFIFVQGYLAKGQQQKAWKK